MTENVQMVLIVAVAVVVVCGIAIFVLKDKIQSGQVEATGKGVKGSLKTHAPTEPPVTSVSGNKIKGDGHTLTARNGGQIDRNEIDGNQAKIDSGNS
jgi:hypothetical protein